MQPRLQETLQANRPTKAPVCVCMCVLHALIALAHHDAAQDADNEPTLWFPEGATNHLLHAPHRVLISGGKK